jgi:glycosyltransferase involved in cell wall biosynthesis
MKILHIIPCYKPAYVYAGVIESVSRLCEALVEAGQTVDVFTTTANGKTELGVKPGVKIDVDGVQVIYFKRLTKDPTHVSPALWMHLWRNGNKYDVIHIHSWWNVLVIISTWICILRGLKIIISPRGMLTNYIFNSTRSATKRWLHRLLGKHALARSVLHATALSEFDECTRLIKGWKGFVLPNILFLSAIQVNRVTNAAFTLLFLSRIHPKKGLELLFQGLKDIPFNIRLRIGGSGDEGYVNGLKRYAEELGIASKVEWLGWKNRDEKFVELMQSDCFILTSHNENFANVVIESLHVGTPVIISEKVGLAPFVRDNNLGWVTSLNATAIHEAIKAAYAGVAQREFVNRRGREIISRAFDPPVLIDQYIKNYTSLK